MPWIVQAQTSRGTSMQLQAAAMFCSARLMLLITTALDTLFILAACLCQAEPPHRPVLTKSWSSGTVFETKIFSHLASW